MRLGIHALTKAENQFFGHESIERSTIIDVWRQCGITDVKLLTSSDSQVKAARWLVDQGFRVIVRFYKPPIATEAVPDDQLRMFLDAGVSAVEGYTNEAEIEWGRPPVTSVIDDLAHAHIRFADACGRVGIKPITPAMQGDRVYTWFEPFVQRVIEIGRRDVLEGSIIGCHPRPVNNLPETAPPGFVVRSYELFDDVLIKHLGRSLDIYATEWGYEPGDSQNNELPKITYASHAAYNLWLTQMNYRPCLKAVYYWTWLHDWFDSGWWRGSIEASMPVVNMFKMQHETQPPKPVEPDIWSREIAIEKIRTWCWDNRQIVNGGRNEGAAFQHGEDLGMPVSSEQYQHGWAWQSFVFGIKLCKEGDWQNVEVINWT